MSRIARQNETYLKRVKASMDRERNHHIERQKEKDATKEAAERYRDEQKKQRNERINKISQSNDRYAEIWIATTGFSVPQVIHLNRHGGDAGTLLNKLDLRIYNRFSKKTEEINLITLIKKLSEHNFPELYVSNRGQVAIDEIVLPAKVYYFIRYQNYLLTGQENQFNLQTEITSANNVP